jgi:hypothetical protein
LVSRSSRPSTQLGGCSEDGSASLYPFGAPMDAS